MAPSPSQQDGHRAPKAGRGSSRCTGPHGDGLLDQPPEGCRSDLRWVWIRRSRSNESAHARAMSRCPGSFRVRHHARRNRSVWWPRRFDAVPRVHPANVPQRVISASSRLAVRQSSTAVPTEGPLRQRSIRHGLELTRNLRNLLALLLDAVAPPAFPNVSCIARMMIGADCQLSSPDRRRPLKPLVHYAPTSVRATVACLPRPAPAPAPRLRGWASNAAAWCLKAPVSSQSTRGWF